MNKNAAALESILFASGDPVPVSRLSLVLSISEEDVLDAADELRTEYLDNGHSIQVVLLGNKLQMCSNPEYASYINRILETRKPPVLSGPALETLAIVAYYQPATIAYINKLRGVDSSYSVSSLCDKGLIEAKDRLEAPGRPLLYSTTDLFLRTMGISNLAELPPLPDMAQNDAIDKLMQEIERLSSKSTDAGVTQEKIGEVI